MMIKSDNPSLINVGSIYSKSAPDWELYKNTNIYNPAAYSSSKAALDYLTKWLAVSVNRKIKMQHDKPWGNRGEKKLFKKKVY